MLTRIDYPNDMQPLKTHIHPSRNLTSIDRDSVILLTKIVNDYDIDTSKMKLLNHTDHF